MPLLAHVRKGAQVLSTETDASTDELRRSVEQLVALAGALEGITNGFAATSTSVEVIAGAAERQREGISQIAIGIRSLSQLAEELSGAGKGLREGLARVEGAHRQLREVLVAQGDATRPSGAA